MGIDHIDMMMSRLNQIGDALERIAQALERQGETVVSSIAPEGLSKEDAARFIGENVSAIENLIRTRKLEYVQHGSQRGRLIPVESLRKFMQDYLQETGEELMKRRKRA